MLALSPIVDCANSSICYSDCASWRLQCCSVVVVEFVDQTLTDGESGKPLLPSLLLPPSIWLSHINIIVIFVVIVVVIVIVITFITQPVIVKNTRILFLINSQLFAVRWEDLGSKPVRWVSSSWNWSNWESINVWYHQQHWGEMQSKKVREIYLTKSKNTVLHNWCWSDKCLIKAVLRITVI